MFQLYLETCCAVCLVAQSYPTLGDLVDCSPCQAPLSMGILQARILEWVVMPSSRGSSQPRARTGVSCIAGGFFTSWATREAHRNGVRGKFVQILIRINLLRLHSVTSVEGKVSWVVLLWELKKVSCESKNEETISSLWNMYLHGCCIVKKQVICWTEFNLFWWSSVITVKNSYYILKYSHSYTPNMATCPILKRS